MASLSDAPGNLILELLRNIRAEVADIRSEMADMRIDLTGKIGSLRADVASDFVLTNAKIDSKFDLVRKETGEQFVGLRRAVIEYHSSVVGHGMLISDLDARVRRVEQHLGPPTMDTH